MIEDSARILLSGNHESIAHRVVTWGEFRAVHSITLTAEELREMALELAFRGSYSFRGATRFVSSTPAPLVMIRLAKDGD